MKITRITTVANSPEEFSLMAAALYGMGYSSGTLLEYSEKKYERIFIYENGALGGNYAGNSTVDSDVSNAEALAAAMGWRVNKTSVKLNDAYTAVIEGDEVVVGCQRFPKSKVLELAELIKKGN